MAKKLFAGLDPADPLDELSRPAQQRILHAYSEYQLFRKRTLESLRIRFESTQSCASLEEYLAIGENGMQVYKARLEEARPFLRVVCDEFVAAGFPFVRVWDTMQVWLRIVQRETGLGELEMNILREEIRIALEQRYTPAGPPGSLEYYSGRLRARIDAELKLVWRRLMVSLAMHWQLTQKSLSVEEYFATRQVAIELQEQRLEGARAVFRAFCDECSTFGVPFVPAWDAAQREFHVAQRDLKLSDAQLEILIGEMRIEYERRLAPKPTGRHKGATVDGNKLRSYRSTLSLTQAEFADKCGVSEKTIKRGEAGGAWSEIAFSRVAEAIATLTGNELNPADLKK
jgi:DNA-binding XRE family transcriptional regulator